MENRYQIALGALAGIAIGYFYGRSKAPVTTVAIVPATPAAPLPLSAVPAVVNNLPLAPALSFSGGTPVEASMDIDSVTTAPYHNFSLSDVSAAISKAGSAISSAGDYVSQKILTVVKYK